MQVQGIQQPAASTAMYGAATSSAASSYAQPQQQHAAGGAQYHGTTHQGAPQASQPPASLAHAQQVATLTLPWLERTSWHKTMSDPPTVHTVWGVVAVPCSNCVAPFKQECARQDGDWGCNCLNLRIHYCGTWVLQQQWTLCSTPRAARRSYQGFLQEICQALLEPCTAPAYLVVMPPRCIVLLGNTLAW